MEERFEITLEWLDSVLCVLIAGRLDARASDRFTQKTDMVISEAGRLLDAMFFGLRCAGLHQRTWLASRLVARPQASWPRHSGFIRRVAGRTVRRSRPSRPPRFPQNVPDQVRSARRARVISDSLCWRGRLGRRPDLQSVPVSAWLRVGNMQDFVTSHRSIHAQRPESNCPLSIRGVRSGFGAATEIRMRRRT